MEYVTTCLMHKMSKREEKEHQGDNVAMVLRQDKVNNSSWCKEVKTCYYCGKRDYITHFDY